MKLNTLRKHARRAIRSALSEAAQELFVKQGYEATTVDDIAAAANISPRSFFRYFASKDEIVIGNHERQSDELAAALSSRPIDEPVWDALRRTFDVAVHYYADARRLERAAAMLSIITSNPTLHASYLEKQERIQQRLIDLLCERAARRGERVEANDILTRAIVGSAYACFQTAIRAAFLSKEPHSLASHLDAVMTTLRPAMLAEGNAASATKATQTRKARTGTTDAP
jgi:AcrR family transcriptional regulator